MSPVLELFHHHLSDGERLCLDGNPRVIYSVERNEARLSTGAVELGPELGPHLLRYEFADEPHLDAQISATLALDSAGEYLVRCDRVELPPGGIAYLHTHRGPGIRCLIQGRFRVEVNGLGQTVERFGAWFESGSEPVEARAVSDEPAAFVRVMVLPRELLGRSSIQYVRDEDRDRPKPQRYQVLVDEPLKL